MEPENERGEPNAKWRIPGTYSQSLYPAFPFLEGIEKQQQLKPKQIATTRHYLSTFSSLVGVTRALWGGGS